MNNCIVTFEYRVMVTAFAILAMFLCVFWYTLLSIHPSHFFRFLSRLILILILILSDSHFAIKVFLRAGVSLKLPGITYIYFSGWGIFLDFRWYFLSLLLVSSNQSIWLHTPLNFASYLWSKTEEKNSDIWTNSDNLRRGKPLVSPNLNFPNGIHGFSNPSTSCKNLYCTCRQPKSKQMFMPSLC